MKKFIWYMNQVRCINVIEKPLLISGIDFIQSIGEKTEGCADDNLGSAALLKLCGSIHDRLTGCDHVI